MAGHQQIPIEQPLDVGSQRSVSSVNWYADHGYNHRTTTRVQPLVCGQKAFEDVATALNNARHSINMAFWGLDPAMVLVRNGDGTYDRENILCEILMKKGAVEGLTVRTANWDPRINSQFLTLTEQHNWGDYESFTERHDTMLHVQLPNMSQYVKTGSYHQKTIIVDVEDPETATAFIMGHNMLGAYWDTTDLLPHDSRRGLRLKIGRLYDVPSQNTYSSESKDKGPLFDVSCQVWGGAVIDVYHNFERSLKSKGHAVTPASSALSAAAFSTQDRPALMSQVAATFPEADPPETSIRQQYFNLITKANKYVFFLNQYFRDPDLTDEIIAELKKRGIPEKKKLPLIFVTNTFEGKFLEEGHDTMVLKKFRDAGIPISLARLVTPHTLNRREIKVHAKVLIVDDAIYSIGSANYNIRSMVADPEINITVLEPSKAEGLRKELLNMIIGSPMDKLVDVADYANLEEAGYNEWLKDLTKNDELYNKGKSFNKGRAITYTPTGWRGVLPTRFAQADDIVPNTTVT